MGLTLINYTEKSVTWQCQVLELTYTSESYLQRASSVCLLGEGRKYAKDMILRSGKQSKDDDKKRHQNVHAKNEDNTKISWIVTSQRREKRASLLWSKKSFVTISSVLLPLTFCCSLAAYIYESRVAGGKEWMGGSIGTLVEGSEHSCGGYDVGTMHVWNCHEQYCKPWHILKSIF